MSKFLTSVRLFDAEAADYDKLSSELKKKSFIAIPGGAQANREAQFKREGNVSIQTVTDEVLRAAGSIGKKYSFTIVRGLPPTIENRFV